ncbi:PASTA domain-containing protein [Frankia sp. Mgl5]|uniref:PASTA domain-containing protein n=1 Tax=Frankia sp. Mgl5 TaxID=2933793 RepID=UPI00200BABED|nr:PASTA domain-containing protein [Frankia sp. Mgl5]MCK9929484.1 PASTA domain-containing protein [Frankia sp. Mgl5]
MDACRSAEDPVTAPGGQPAAGPLRPDDPSELGHYRVLGRLGEGGMGTVFLGAAPDGRPVAIKMIRAEVAGVPSFRARFRREAELARRVARFCTAELLDAVDPPDGPPFIVTEFVDGPTLAAAVAAGGPLGAADLERVAVSVAAALTAIHGAGLVHRDLKPANVLLSSLGPRVIDFGIAHAADITHVTRDSIVGTPAFMAPEQALAQPVSGAADVWAWAGLVTFAGTGRPPFGDGPPETQIFRIVHGDPNLDGLDPALGAVVRRAMSRQPTDRPTAQDLLQQLVTLGVEVPASATSALALPTADGGAPPQGRAPASGPIPPTSPAGPSSSPSSPSAARRTRPERRPSGRMLVAALAGVVVVLVGAWLLLQAQPPDGRDDTDARVSAAPAPGDPTGPPDGQSPGGGEASPGTATATGPGPGGTAGEVTPPGEPVEIPDVVGRPVAEAEEALRTAGLTNIIRTTRLDDRPAGSVIGMHPAAGSEVSRDAAIELDVSDGPGHTTVPDLVGRSEVDARSGLDTAGLKMVVQENSGPSKVGPGLVERTDPPGGTQVAYGTTVTISVVSRQVAVPDVVGQSAAAATATLRDYGFDVVEERGAGSQPAGVVIAQLPRAGLVTRGATVTITVSQPRSNGDSQVTQTPEPPPVP